MHKDDTVKKRIGRKTIVVIAVAIVLAALTVYTFYGMNGNSMDLRDREIRLIVTDSMDGERTSYDVPTIPKDSLVVVRLLSEDEKLDLKEGDVVQFHYKGVLNHHRVVSNNTEEGYVITHGDNTDVNETVKYSDVRGEVVGANHAAGEVVSFAKTYVFVIIAFIVVLFIGSLLVDEIRREKQKEEKQNEL